MTSSFGNYNEILIATRNTMFTLFYYSVYLVELMPNDVIQFAVPPRYEYWDVEGLDLSHRTSLVFEILGKQHIFIALCRYRFTYEADRMYSFLVGENVNTRTTLRLEITRNKNMKVSST